MSTNTVRSNVNAFCIHKKAFDALKRDRRLFEQTYKELVSFVNTGVSKKQFEKISENLWSLRLNDGNRALISENKAENLLVIHAVGPHDKVYNWWDRLKRVPTLETARYIQLSSLDKLAQINHPAPHYRLDPEQLKVKELAFTKGHAAIAVCGMPGSGKTLMLNKIAYELMKQAYKDNRDPDFLYITFSSELKDRIRNEIINHIEEDEALLNHEKDQLKSMVLRLGWFLTFEDFILQTAKKLGIDIKKYATMASSMSTMRHLKKYNKKFSALHLTEFELINIINSEALVDYRSSHEFWSKRLERSNLSASKKIIELIREFNEEFERTLLNKEGKKSFRQLLREVKENLDGRDYIGKSILLIDERQDISNEASDLILKIWNYDNDYWKKKIILSWDERQFIVPTGSAAKNVKNWFKTSDMIELKKNHRNSMEIAKFANFFKNLDYTQSEESGIPVKLVFGDLNQTLTKLSELLREKGSFLGMVAIIAPQEYKQKIEDELNGLQVMVYSVETVKGLEFSNVVILDFMGIISHKNIEPIDLNKWYVAITRCRENLLVHFNNEEEFRELDKEIFHGELQKDVMIKIGAEELLDEFVMDIQESEEDVWEIQFEEANTILSKAVEDERVSSLLIRKALETLKNNGFYSKIMEYYEKNPNVWYPTELVEFLKISATLTEYRRLYGQIRKRLSSKDFSRFFKSMLLDKETNSEVIEFILWNEENPFQLLLKSLGNEDIPMEVHDKIENIITKNFEGKEKYILTAELELKKGNLDDAVETLFFYRIYDHLHRIYRKFTPDQRKNLSEQSKKRLLYINSLKRVEALKSSDFEAFWKLYCELYGEPKIPENAQMVLEKVKNATPRPFYNLWSGLFYSQVLLKDLKKHTEKIKRGG